MTKDRGQRWLLGVGLLAMAVSLLLRNFAHLHSNAGDFIVGLLLGISIVLLIASFTRMGRQSERT